MPIAVKCPQCGSELEVPDDAAGKKARCPDCGAVVALPRAPSDDEAADILLEGDPDRAIAAAPGGAPVVHTPAEEAHAPPRPRRRRPIDSAALVRPTRNGTARFASSFALLSLVPGLALLFGPLALLLGLVGFAVGRLRGRDRGTRDVVAALVLGLLTTAGNWGLVLYVRSVLGLPAPVERVMQRVMPPARRPAAPAPDGGPDFGFGHRPHFPDFDDPFGEKEEKPNPARRRSLEVGDQHIRAAAFSSDGKRALVRRFDGLELWDLQTEKKRAPDVPGDAEAWALSPDGRWLALASDAARGDVRLYDCESGECRKTLKGAASSFGPMGLLAFSADGFLLATGGDRGVGLWRTDGWDEVKLSLRRDLLDPHAIALSPDGSALALATNRRFADGSTIVLWDTREGKEIKTLAGHDVDFKAIAFAPDGMRLAAAGWEDVKVWDVAKGSLAWSFGREHFNTALAFSPDGRLLASGSEDGSLVLSDAATGKRLAGVRRVWHRDGHTLAVAFTADGTLLTATDQGVIERWDVAELLKQGPPQ